MIGITVHRLTLCISILISFHIGNAAENPAGDRNPESAAYIRQVIRTIETYPPDSVVIDTADCRSTPKTRQLSAFDRILRCNAFKKAECLRTIHAYRINPRELLFTSVYVMSFSKANLSKAVNVLRKQKSPFFPIKSVEYYRWHVFANTLVLLVLEATPQYDLFNHLDTMTVEYLKSTSPSPSPTGGAAHE